MTICTTHTTSSHRRRSLLSTTITCLFLALVVSSKTTNAIELDIHLKLEPSSCLYQLALEANQKLHQDSPTEQISFQNTLPHISLYLTHFNDENITQLIHSLENMHLPEPPIEIDGVTANGAYAMYHIHSHHTLQSLSDIIVQTIKPFIIPDQVVPSWVYDLPEPARSRKIAYVKEYGSPNVFDEFEPHMTVGYDSADDDDVSISSDKEDRRWDILWKTLESDGACRQDHAGMIGVGVVGEWGTVIYDLIAIHLDSYSVVGNGNGNENGKVQVKVPSRYEYITNRLGREHLSSMEEEDSVVAM